MNIILFGGAGFIGTNLSRKLAENKENNIIIVDKSKVGFLNLEKMNLKNVVFKERKFDMETDFEEILENQDIVYHLISTTVPTTSNQDIAQEMMSNVVVTAKLLDACVASKVKKVIFLSSGGTVYGKSVECPLKEDAQTNPITSYGVQKLTIEKLLYLYNHMYGLDYRVVRLSNPYGPFQRPNGVQGVITTFVYKALKEEDIVVFGDGSVVRDFIYIDDAVNGIIKIAENQGSHKVYNLGCGKGTSINHLLEVLQNVIDRKMNIIYKPGRNVDVGVNYLDIEQYEKDFGKLSLVSLEKGILNTMDFLKNNYIKDN